MATTDIPSTYKAISKLLSESPILFKDIEVLKFNYETLTAMAFILSEERALSLQREHVKEIAVWYPSLKLIQFGDVSWNTKSWSTTTGGWECIRVANVWKGTGRPRRQNGFPYCVYYEENENDTYL